MDLYTALACFIAGACSSMGFGAGSVLIIYLVNHLGLPQKQAQGINLIFFIPAALLSLIIYHRKGLVNFRSSLGVIALAVAGALVGYSLLDIIPARALSKLFGASLIFFGASTLFGKSK